jgi:hypothetical protein
LVDRQLAERDLDDIGLTDIRSIDICPQQCSVVTSINLTLVQQSIGQKNMLEVSRPIVCRQNDFRPKDGEPQQQRRCVYLDVNVIKTFKLLSQTKLECLSSAKKTGDSKKGA